MPSIKQRRLEGIIRKNITEIIQFELKDPSVGFVTISEVEVSNDHSFATCYVSFLGKDARNEAGLKALQRAKGYIKSELAKRLAIRRTPELIFKLDSSIKQGQHIEEILHKIHEEQEKSQDK